MFYCGSTSERFLIFRNQFSFTSPEEDNGPIVQKTSLQGKLEFSIYDPLLVCKYLATYVVYKLMFINRSTESI